MAPHSKTLSTTRYNVSEIGDFANQLHTETYTRHTGMLEISSHPYRSIGSLSGLVKTFFRASASKTQTPRPTSRTQVGTHGAITEPYMSTPTSVSRHHPGRPGLSPRSVRASQLRRGRILSPPSSRIRSDTASSDSCDVLSRSGTHRCHRGVYATCRVIEWRVDLAALAQIRGDDLAFQGPAWALVFLA